MKDYICFQSGGVGRTWLQNGTATLGLHPWACVSDDSFVAFFQNHVHILSKTHLHKYLPADLWLLAVALSELDFLPWGITPGHVPEQKDCAPHTKVNDRHNTETTKWLARRILSYLHH